MGLRIGDYVKENPVTWVPNDFDSWGRGVGIGQVVEPPFEMGADEVDVKWPEGRCFENVSQLLPAIGTEVETGLNKAIKYAPALWSST